MSNFFFQFNVTEFAIVVIISVIVTLLFDLPMMEIKSIILDRSSTDSSEGKLTSTSRKNIEVTIPIIISEQTEATEEQPEGEENPEPQEGEEEINPEDLEVEKILEDVEYLPDEEDIEEIEIEEYEDEAYEEQPLRRSSRVRFDDEIDDKEVWEDKIDKGEKQAEIEDFWGKDED